MHIPTWSNRKQAQQWINTLTAYAFPYFGDKKMDAIDSADILAALTPIWTTKPETARRVKQWMGTVLKWAIAKGWHDDNPSATISSALSKDRKKVKAHRSLPFQEVPAAIATIRNSKASTCTRLALEILILTALRSGEIRNGKWEEVDWDNKCWTVPRERMKQRKEHKVPLTPRCLAILEEAKQLRDKSGLIFPTANTGKSLSDVTFSKLVRELGLKCVPHGFRSSFRVWAGEKTNFPREVCEFALPHVVGDEAERAYQRSDLFDKRRKLIDAWANHCLNVDCSADVVSIQKTTFLNHQA